MRVLASSLMLLHLSLLGDICMATDPSSPLLEDRREFERRFSPLRDLVLDPARTFSASGVHRQLESIEALARRIGNESAQLAQVLDLMSLVQFKRQDFEQSLALGAQSLAIGNGSAIPPPQRLLLLDRMAKSAEWLGDYETAVAHYRAVLALSDAQQAALLTDSQRLGVREAIGRVLHESGRYAEAAATNRLMLADAEAQFGRDDPRLVSVLNNLAQNLYQLGRPGEAREMLGRRLALAESADDSEVADDTLFQLGVLAFESGDVAQARAWMRKRIDAAANSGDSARTWSAAAAAAELEQRIAGGRPPPAGQHDAETDPRNR